MQCSQVLGRIQPRRARKCVMCVFVILDGNVVMRAVVRE